MPAATAETLASEPISPELVLVDAALRTRLLATQTQAPPVVTPRPKARYGSSCTPAADASRAEQPRATGALRGRTHLRRLTPLLLASAAGAGALFGFVNSLHLAATHLDPVVGAAIPREALAPAASLPPTPALGKPSPRTDATTTVAFVTRPAPQPARSTVAPPPDPMTPPTRPTFVPAPDLSARGQRIAWAPVPGAAAYDVELARDGTAVFATRTSSTTMFLPVYVHSAAPGQVLQPGIYTWYVWPVRGNRREGTAIVSSKLLVL